MSAGRIRVLLADPGLDDEDRAAGALARALRDAGMEVVYTAGALSAEQVVRIAIQEDVDAVGVPPEVVTGSRNGLEDVHVFAVDLPADEAAEAVRNGIG